MVVEDLEERGLLLNTLLVMVGEFGRHAKIVNAGRNHWPACDSALLAGVCIRGGAVYGDADQEGGLRSTRKTRNRKDCSVTSATFTKRGPLLLRRRKCEFQQRENINKATFRAMATIPGGETVFDDQD